MFNEIIEDLTDVDPNMTHNIFLKMKFFKIYCIFPIIITSQNKIDN